MPDREKTRPTTSDEWSDHISEFAHKWEVGSAEHSAINDYHGLQHLYGKIGKEDKRLHLDIPGEASLTPEQRQDLILQRIALLENSIDQKSGSLPGYGKAYTEMLTSFDELIRVAGKEAKDKYSEQDKQEEYVKHIYDQTMDNVFEGIFEQQNRNI